VKIAAGIDHSVALTPAAKAYSWGFSANYRAGLGTEDSVPVPMMIRNTAVSKAKLIYAACGGQYVLSLPVTQFSAMVFRANFEGNITQLYPH
jgi:alpha-tubulin suppressor-like RCC1 family protein